MNNENRIQDEYNISAWGKYFEQVIDSPNVSEHINCKINKLKDELSRLESLLFSLEQGNLSNININDLRKIIY